MLKGTAFRCIVLKSAPRVSQSDLKESNNMGKNCPLCNRPMQFLNPAHLQLLT